MDEKAILATEEALLATLFTQRALVNLLIEKGVIGKDELEREILKTETKSIGAGQSDKYTYLDKRRGRERRRKGRGHSSKEKRSGKERRQKS